LHVNLGFYDYGYVFFWNAGSDCPLQKFLKIVWCQNISAMRPLDSAQRLAPATAGLTREHETCGQTAVGWAQWLGIGG